MLWWGSAVSDGHVVIGCLGRLAFRGNGNKWHDVTLEMSYLSKSCFSGEIERTEGDATASLC